MAVYIVAKIDITDRERYGQYEAGFMAIFERFGGRLHAVDEDVTVLEGGWPATRSVLIEFDDSDQAMAWYRSAEYQALAQHRFAASSANIVMLQSLSTRAPD